MRKNLTSAFVDSVPAPENGQVDYWDEKIPGFGLRVSKGGRKAWVLMYRHLGVKRRLLLGTYVSGEKGLPLMTLADARDKARRELNGVQAGEDPARLKKDIRKAPTFADLSQRYLSEHAREKKKASSVHEDEKMLRRELLPAFGARKAADIADKDIIDLLDGIMRRGAGVAANRVLSLVKKVFSFAVSKRIVEKNPASEIEKPGKETQRDRVLTDDEIHAVWRALEAQPSNVAGIFRLALLTGQRRSEIAEMRLSELDLKTGWWTLPKERTKRGIAHRVPLVGSVLAILRQRSQSRSGSGLVFAGAVNSRWHGKGASKAEPIISLGKPLASVIKAAGTAPFTIHDLRRTCATGLAKAGVREAVISKLLNHATGRTTTSRITLIYNRYEYDKEIRDALLTWDAVLLKIVSSDSQPQSEMASA